MKRFIGCLLLLTLLLMTLSISLAVSFNDVKNTKYANAVDMLTSLGIVNGYADGTYKPNNTVTRAEMAKLIIVALGKEDASEALKNDAKFTDVKKGSWAAGYINYAANQGIIKGYPEGTFMPNSQVTYAEAATMLLRTLNYTKELESKKYPTEYMTIANEAGLLTGVIASSAKEGASRGNVALMVLNTLKGNVRKIISSTTNGTFTYGNGDVFIEKTFPNLKYIKDGLVYDLDFEEEEMVIKDSTNNRKITVVYDEDLCGDIRKLYLREVELIYNTSKKEFLYFNISDDYSVATVDIDDIDNKYIYDTKNNKYKYDEVLLYSITNYEEAEIAYIVLDGDEVISVILEGTPKVYIGLVENPSITVKKNKGVSLINEDGDIEELAFSSSSSTKIKDEEVILYSLDNSGYIILHERIGVSDCNTIEELTSDSIKVKKDKKIELNSDTEFYVYEIPTSRDEINEIKLKNIDDEFDTACVTEYDDVYYIIVYRDSVNTDDVVSKLSVSEAKEALQDTIKLANKYIKKESSYSVESFEVFKEALEEANAAMKGSSSAAKLELLDKKLSQAIDGLDSSSSSDKELRTAYSKLEATISDAESKKQTDYTATSYSKLTTALKAAKAIKLSNTTVSKIDSANTELKKAINLLVTTAANTEIESAKATLKTLITKAETLYKSKADYTDASASKLNTALTNAKKLDQSTATISEIKTQISNLEAAIDGMVLKVLDTYKTARNKLETKYKAIIAVKGDNYTKESFDKFTAEVNAIKAKYKELKDVATVETMNKANAEAEIKKVNDLITKIDSANKLLVSSSLAKARERLKAYIDEAKAIKESEWKSTSFTYAQLQTLISNAEKVYNDPNKTENEIKAVISEFAINLE